MGAEEEDPGEEKGVRVSLGVRNSSVAPQCG